MYEHIFITRCSPIIIQSTLDQPNEIVINIFLSFLYSDTQNKTLTFLFSDL